MKKKYQKIQKHYDEIHKIYIANSAIVLERLLKTFIKHLQKGSAIFDIGCGPGHDTDYFTKKGFETTGIDFSPKMIDYAKKHNQGKFYQADITAEDFFKKFTKIDNAWISAMLMHLEPSDQIKFLSKLKKHLSKDGIVGIIVPLRDKQRELKVQRKISLKKKDTK